MSFDVELPAREVLVAMVRSVLTRDVQRGITAILYLNSNFAGGEIRFPKQGLELRPSAGLLVIFPSNRNFPHEVKPILRGRPVFVPAHLWNS